MRFFHNELEYLQKENRLRRKALSEESNRWINGLTRRLTTARVGLFERALAEKKLIGKALAAESQNRPSASVKADDEAFLDAVLTGKSVRVGELLLNEFLAVSTMFCIYTIFPFLLKLLDHGISSEQLPLHFWERGALNYLIYILVIALGVMLIMLVVDLFALHPRLQNTVMALLLLGFTLSPLLFPDFILPSVDNRICVGTALLSVVLLLASRLAWNAYVHSQSERLEWRD